MMFWSKGKKKPFKFKRVRTSLLVGAGALLIAFLVGYSAGKKRMKRKLFWDKLKEKAMGKIAVSDDTQTPYEEDASDYEEE
ncbi:MAG: hypothetical protein IJT34_12030 [Butyrivibrio sp.]|nr:hypothetical protein [Butyrivibrio sp.]